jgi:hypothetical protein
MVSWTTLWKQIIAAMDGGPLSKSLFFPFPWGSNVHVSLTCTILETLTKKSLILVRRKTAPSRAQITTKIYLSATVNKNLSKKQHIKKLCPYKWKSVEKSFKTLVIFQKSSSNWFRVSSQTCTDHKVRSNIIFYKWPFPNLSLFF